MEADGVLSAVYDDINKALRVTGFDDAVFLAPANFSLAVGTPAISVVNDVPSWELDPAATEAILGAFILPTYWGTVALDFWWGKRAGTTGNVRWRMAIKDLVSGDLITEAFVSDISANVAVPGTANAAVLRTDHNTGIAVAPNHLYALRAERTGADAGDTFASDAAFFGARLRRTG